MTRSKLAKASTKSAVAITKAQAGLLSQILDNRWGNPLLRQRLGSP